MTAFPSPVRAPHDAREAASPTHSASDTRQTVSPPHTATDTDSSRTTSASPQAAPSTHSASDAHQATSPPHTASDTPRPASPPQAPADVRRATASAHASVDARQVLGRCRALVQPALREAVGRTHSWVGEMAAYSFGWCEVGGAPTTGSGGKGVRQALAVLGAEAVGASGGVAVPGAVAVELVHAFSLLHDDIMDGDTDRRRRPTVWKAYGTGPAVLAGDALFALAVETLAAAPAGPRAVRQLSVALQDLVRGQADDLLFATRPWTGPERVRPDEYRAMAEHKTGALLGCAAALGALLGGAPPATVCALDRAGRHLGVAFQVVDDLLGIWGDPAVTGKPVFGDLRERKKTFPVLAALDSPAAGRLRALLESDAGPGEVAALIEESGGRSAALAEARRQVTAAQAALADVPLEAETAEALRSLIDFLVRRDQ